MARVRSKHCSACRSHLASLWSCQCYWLEHVDTAANVFAEFLPEFLQAFIALESMFSYKTMPHRNLNIAVFVVALCSIGLPPRIGLRSRSKIPDRSVASPNGKIVFRLLDRDPNCLRYQVSFDNEPVIESSRLGITIDGVNLDQGPESKRLKSTRSTSNSPASAFIPRRRTIAAVRNFFFFTPILIRALF